MHRMNAMREASAVRAHGPDSSYSTATSRALYRTIEELERVQEAGKALEGSASATD